MAASESKALSPAALLFKTTGACYAHIAPLLTRRTHVWVLLSCAGLVIGPSAPGAIPAHWRSQRERSLQGASGPFSRLKAAQALLQDDHRALLRPFLRGGHAARACALHVALRGAGFCRDCDCGHATHIKHSYYRVGPVPRNTAT